MASDPKLPTIPDEIYDLALEGVQRLRGAIAPGVVLSDDTVTSAALDFARGELHRAWMEERVEAVARALFERAMSERRGFSTPEKARGFTTPWHAVEEPMQHGWRMEARVALGLDGGED